MRVDETGITASTIALENRVTRWCLMIHAPVLTREREYLSEFAVLRSLRRPPYWTSPGKADQQAYGKLTIHAGGSGTTYVLRQWMETGTISLCSASASPLMDDISLL